MKPTTKNLTLLSLLIAGALSAQNNKRLVLHNQSFVVLNHSAFLVVDNPLPQALTVINGGHIISEGENNILKWSVGQAGNYCVPFAGKQHEDIPVSVNIPEPVTGKGALLFATYQDADKAALLSTTQTAVQDRFWRVEATGFNASSAELSLPAKDAITNAVSATNVAEVVNGHKVALQSSSHTWALSNARLTGTANVFGAAANIRLFPNPLEQSAVLSYELTQDANVQAELLNEQGMVLQSLIAQQQQGKGNHHISVNGDGLPAGAYSLRLVTGTTVQVIKFIKL